MSMSISADELTMNRPDVFLLRDSKPAKKLVGHTAAGGETINPGGIVPNGHMFGKDVV